MKDQPIAAVDLYLNADKDVVVEAGLDAAYLLVRAGKPIPAGYAAPVKPEPVKKAPVKARKKPADKARKKGGDK